MHRCRYRRVHPSVARAGTRRSANEAPDPSLKREAGTSSSPARRHCHTTTSGRAWLTPDASTLVAMRRHELSLRDVFAARRRIAPYLPRTPLFGYPALDEVLGATVSVKHENHQPIGAFKVRGGVNLVAQLSDDERTRGLISASTGNHGQSIAYAARLFGARAVICVPEGANPVKVAAIENLGAEIVVHGRDFDDARAVRGARLGVWVPLCPFGERTGPDRWRRHGGARDRRGRAGDRG